MEGGREDHVENYAEPDVERDAEEGVFELRLDCCHKEGVEEQIEQESTPHSEGPGGYHGDG